MSWKLIQLYFAIAVISFSDGNGKSTIKSNFMPDNIVTTTEDRVTREKDYSRNDTTEVNFFPETELEKQSTKKQAETTEDNNVDNSINGHTPVDTTKEQDSNEIQEENTTKESCSTKVLNILNSQEQEPECSKSFETQVIVTENGPVIGHYLEDSQWLRRFIDIPYGAIPGLFMGPVKPSPWEKVHQVSDHSKRCPQVLEPDSFVGELDCLTLSIFTPMNVEKAPVLFHIHDGASHTGSGDPSIYGPEYLVSKGAVLVLPNYRLGPLGFLCLQNSVVPGNAGLKDLSMALEWTATNIAAFGGDPLNIAVSGEGTSGALAGLLALSPKSRGFISKLITDTGSLLAPWAYDRDPINTSASLAEAIRSNLTGDIDLKMLTTAAKDFVLRPCVERGPDAFMDETPWEMLNAADQKNITFMIGTANYAGIHEALDHNAKSLASLSEDFSQILPEDLKFTDEDEKLAISNEIKKMYFKEENITTGDMEELSLYYTDAFYLGPALRYARSLIASGATVFFYEFSFVGEMNRALNSLETTIQGAARGDIIGYVFTQDGEVAQENTEEKMVADLITDLWLSFLKYGRPIADNVHWNKLEQVAEMDERYLNIDLKPKVEKGVHKDRLTTWTDIYNTYYVEIDDPPPVGQTNLAARLKPSPYSFSILIWLLTSIA